MQLTLKHRTNNSIALLEISVDYNEKLEIVLARLNKFRAPNNQISKLYNEFGQEIPLTYQVKGNITFYYI